MKFQILTAAFAASAAALPALQPRLNGSSAVGDNLLFSLIAIRSGSEIQNAPISAASNSLLLNLPSQNASCAGDNGPNYAFFYLQSGSLYLWTLNNATQELYTDRSGMGQGVLQYTTSPGGLQPSRNGETKGWEVDEAGELSFDGAGLIACPGSIDGAWSLWVNAGVANPGGNSGCLGISSRAILSSSETATACNYSYSTASA